ncbi:hypothetical protein D1872_288610 [compost metagenome]
MQPAHGAGIRGDRQLDRLLQILCGFRPGAGEKFRFLSRSYHVIGRGDSLIQADPSRGLAHHALQTDGQMHRFAGDHMRGNVDEGIAGMDQTGVDAVHKQPGLPPQVLKVQSPAVDIRRGS